MTFSLSILIKNGRKAKFPDLRKRFFFGESFSVDIEGNIKGDFTNDAKIEESAGIGSLKMFIEFALGFERIIAILRDAVGDDRIPITPESDLAEDLGLSSLEVVNLIVAFEDEFGIEIPERIIPDMHTVKDIADYLEKNAD